MTDEQDAGRDLGTYWVRAEYGDAGGFWCKWETGGRFTAGTKHLKPLTAEWMQPTWEDEADVLASILCIFTEGNYACDCNVLGFFDEAQQKNQGDEHVRYPCGGALRLSSLSVRCPDGRVVQLEVA